MFKYFLCEKFRRMKKIIFTGLLFLLLPRAFIYANVVFTEVMYDPAGTDSKHEWVEVYNDGTESVDLTKYFLQTDGTYSSYHSISSISTSMLPPDRYAVVAQDVPTFQTDNPGYGGIVYDSSWSDLSDTVGKTLVINDPNKVSLNQYTYNISIGANNDGNSLQKTSSESWVSALPTPGIATIDTSSDSSSTTQKTDTNNGSSSSTNSSISSSTFIFPVNNPQAQLLIPKNIIAGIPIKIVPSISGANNIPFSNKSFHISFGDGFEHYDYSTLPVFHTYLYPGTYVVYFEYIQKPNNPDEGDVLSVRKTIEVMPSTVLINKINIDSSVEISNPSSRDIDISHWILRSLVSPDIYFTIPKNTIMLPGKKIILSHDITGISYDNLKSLELSLPSGSPVAVYGDEGNLNSQEYETNTVLDSSSKVSNKKEVASYSTTISEEDLKSQTISSDANIGLEAQALNSLPSDKSPMPVIPIVIGFAGMIVVSIYIIKSLNSVPQNENNELEKNENISTKAIADRIRIIEDDI